MKKRVFIIHGWEGSPDSNWFPWIKNELIKSGYEAVALQMPKADFPKSEEWLLHMQETIGEVDDNTFLIGHSLGVIAILHFIESLPRIQKVGGAILVAGFSESIGTIPEIQNFFDKSLDYEKIKTNCKNFVAINSDDDPYVDMRFGEIFEDKLDAKLIKLHGAGHINIGNGFFELPIALEELLRISK